LLQPGEHVRSIDEIREMCVVGFPLSTTRRVIMDGLLKIVEMLKAEQIPCELVVDGSFLTEEIEPDDVDFAVVVTPEFYESCTSSQRKLLDWIGDDKTIKDTHFSDCYLCVNYSEGHPLWCPGICDRPWWLNLYSKSVVVKRERGVVVVNI
jgi:hypothetical protein